MTAFLSMLPVRILKDHTAVLVTMDTLEMERQAASLQYQKANNIYNAFYLTMVFSLRGRGRGGARVDF